jgi:hypothetical protein
MWSQNDIAEVDGDIVRHIFSSLRMGKDDAEWDSLALAFELADNPIRYFYKIFLLSHAHDIFL